MDKDNNNDKINKKMKGEKIERPESEVWVPPLQLCLCPYFCHPSGHFPPSHPLSKSKQAEQLPKCRKFLHTIVSHSTLDPIPIPASPSWSSCCLVQSPAFILAISFRHHGKKGRRQEAAGRRGQDTIIIIRRRTVFNNI